MFVRVRREPSIGKQSSEDQKYRARARVSVCVGAKSQGDTRRRIDGSRFIRRSLWLVSMLARDSNEY